MIYTNKENFKDYLACNQLFKEVLGELLKLASAPFERGKHEYFGKDYYINAAEYDTKPLKESVFEAHRRYVDVMLLLSGEEMIAVKASGEATNILKEYSEKEECFLAAIEGDFTRLCMHAGDIAVLFPQDAHAPGIDLRGKSLVRKLIAKVPFECMAQENQ